MKSKTARSMKNNMLCYAYAMLQIVQQSAYRSLYPSAFGCIFCSETMENEGLDNKGPNGRAGNWTE